MVSIASRHIAKIQAEKKAGEETSLAFSKQYRLNLLKLDEAKRELKAIRSREARNVFKKSEVIPEFEKYINQVIEDDDSNQNDVLVMLSIWNIDVKNYERGIELAAYAIKHNMQSPEGFSRNIAEIIAEQVSEQVIVHTAPETLKDIMIRVNTLVEGRDMQDVVTVKLNRALGLSLEKVEPERALQHFNRAFQLDPKATVKRNINRLTKLINTED